MSDSLPQAAPPRAFVQALRRALRPLVGLMLARGVTYGFASELLKSLFVEVADRDFRLEGKTPTDSRVSLVSGVHRKEVSRLRQAFASGDETMPEVISLGAQVVAQWLGGPPYSGRDGRPRPLARFASEGGELSFESLVARVNRDIRPRVVLDEWLRLGVVHVDEQGLVCLDTSAFVPSQGFEEMSFYLGHNLHDHAAAIAHNLRGAQPAFLERSVHYDGLSPEAVAALRTESRTIGTQALVQINKRAMALSKKDRSADTPRERMTFGVYFFSDAVAPTVAQANEGDEPTGAPVMPADIEPPTRKARSIRTTRSTRSTSPRKGST